MVRTSIDKARLEELLLVEQQFNIMVNKLKRLSSENTTLAFTNHKRGLDISITSGYNIRKQEYKRWVQ